MTPFIVIGMPRTGSTLLLTGIMQHPQIVAYGELMHPAPMERHVTHAIRRGDALVSYNPERDAISFLKNEVFDFPHPGSKKAAGFKLFGDYVKSPGSERLFLRLKDEIEGLHVVHIVRPNHLDTLISLKLARATGIWQRGRKEEQKYVTVDISPEEAERHFKLMHDTDRWMEGHFAGPRYLKVDYDEMSASYAPTMYKVYAFLGAYEYIAGEYIRKQIERPRHEVVANYGELAKHFAGKPQSSFFAA